MRTLPCLLLLGLAFGLCASAAASDASLPDTPQPAPEVSIAPEGVAPSLSAIAQLPRLSLAILPQHERLLPLAPPRRVLDRRYLSLAIATLALTSVDVEMTQHCMHAGTCYEMNPTLPNSRWGQYAANSATNLAVLYYSYRRKKAGKWGWWLPPAIDIGAHLVGIGSNVRFLSAPRTVGALPGR